jgi:hypothetical protein
MVIRPTVLSKHDTTRLQGAIPSTPPVLGLRRECFEKRCEVSHNKREKESELLTGLPPTFGCEGACYDGN